MRGLLSIKARFIESKFFAHLFALPFYLTDLITYLLITLRYVTVTRSICNLRFCVFEHGERRTGRSHAAKNMNKKCAAGFGRHGMPPLMTQVQDWAMTAQTDHVNVQRRPVTLEVVAPVADADRRLPSVYQV